MDLGLWESDMCVRKWPELSLRVNLMHLLLDWNSELHAFLAWGLCSRVPDFRGPVSETCSWGMMCRRTFATDTRFVGLPNLRTLLLLVGKVAVGTTSDKDPMSPTNGDLCTIDFCGPFILSLLITRGLQENVFLVTLGLYQRNFLNSLNVNCRCM